eukprot:TRINITY_DN112149_c0_g1_i1.p1 TRINITY_DN112149_c0_g1~~TRINITY_DN112149_c0_g1_i1.p1  ORF type:complete len:812 (+),score=126.77 TRINITY_DN112149_c0_g1_i1:148-2583(+)
MYGWIQQSIEQLVLDKFGLDTWNQIKEEAGCHQIPVSGWVRHESYDDALTLKLVGAASKVLKLEAADVLTVYGGYFIEWLCAQGYQGYLKSQGRDLFEFLDNMDRMHANLHLSMPELRPPAMKVKPEGSASLGSDDWEVLWLTYSSQRGGLGTMMLGIVPTCARLLFGQEISCTLEKQWKETPPPAEPDSSPGSSPAKAVQAEVERSLYRIVKAAAETTDDANGAKPENADAGALAIGKNSYNFFQDNPVMAPGWVECVIEDVSKLNPVTAKSFASSFDVRMLTSLLLVSTPHAIRAIRCLFRAPVKNEDVSMPCPTLSYFTSKENLPYTFSRCYPGVSMTKDVTFGSHTLVQIAPDRRESGLLGLLKLFQRPRSMHPIVVSVCMVPNLHTNSHLLRALYETPNDHILKEPIVSALIAAAAASVFPRVVLTVVLHTLCIALVTFWLVSPSDRFVGWPLLVILLLKSLASEVTEFVAYLKRGWLRKFLSLSSRINLVWAAIQMNLLYAVLTESVTDAQKRYSLGFYACMAWWIFLRDMCYTEFLGPKVLPIITALASLGPFMIFIGMICAGFAYLLAALDGGLDDANGAIYLAALQAALLPEIMSDPSVPAWMEVWLYILTAVLGVVLLNILIGVLSEAYDVAHDESAVIYNRTRVLHALNTRLSTWGRAVSAQERMAGGGPVLAFFRNMVTVECHERCGGDPVFLWVVAEKFSRSETARRTRLGTLKDHVTNACLQVHDDVTKDLTKVIDTKTLEMSKCPMFSSALTGKMGAAKCPVPKENSLLSEADVAEEEPLVPRSGKENPGLGLAKE